MINGPRRSIEIEVFDFETDQFAYAPESKKNIFGYRIKKTITMPDGKTKVVEDKNNVEECSKVYKMFHINRSQMRSLKRAISSASKNGKTFIIPFPEDKRIEVVFRNGNRVTYTGNHPDEFCQKVMRKVR